MLKLGSPPPLPPNEIPRLLPLGIELRRKVPLLWMSLKTLCVVHVHGCGVAWEMERLAIGECGEGEPFPLPSLPLAPLLCCTEAPRRLPVWTTRPTVRPLHHAARQPWTTSPRRSSRLKVLQQEEKKLPRVAETVSETSRV